MDGDLERVEHVGGEPAAERVVASRPHLDHLERVDGGRVEVDADAVGGLAEGETQQPLLHQLAFEEHLGGVGLGEGRQLEAEGVGRTHQAVDEGHPFVGQVVIEVGVHVLEGEDEERLVGQSAEAETTFLVGAREVVGGLAAREQEQAVEVGQVRIKADKEFLDGFASGGVDDGAREVQGVEDVACGESISKVFKSVAFV